MAVIVRHQSKILRTIWINSETQRTFHVGEIVAYYVGDTVCTAEIVSFEGGNFHVRIGSETFEIIGAVFAQALKPSRRPWEQIRGAA